MENIFVEINLVSIKNISPQIYNGLQIYLAIKGDMQIDVNKNRFTLNTNDVLVINSHDMYAIRGGESSIALVLKIPFEYMRRECEDMLQYTIDCYSGGQDGTTYDEIRRLLIYMMMIYSHMNEGYRLNIRASLFQLLHYLLINFGTGKQEKQMVKTGKKDSHIAAVLDYINENYKQSITLEDLAKREFMSVHYLSRLFKNQVGIGFLDYMNHKRLESAVTDLIYTEASILSIALQNGFANTKSFSAVFKKRYEETPNQFRQRHQKKSLPAAGGEYTSHSVEELEGLGALVKYLKLYEERNERSVTAGVTDISVPICPGARRPEREKRVVKIGRWSEALNRDVQEELALVQQEIGFDYVHFKGIFGDGIYQFDPASNYSCYDYVRALSYFDTIGLIPFIQIDVGDAAGQLAAGAQIGEAVERFLLLLRRHVSTENMDQWKFELICKADGDEAFCTGAYHMIFTAIKGISKEIEVGFSAEAMGEEQADSLGSLKETLSFCREVGCVPDFITFTADPGRSLPSMGLQADAYGQLRGFHVSAVKRLREVLEGCGLKDTGLYLMDWNTISGQSLLEAGSYYRAALIAETVLGLDGHADGMAVWLSEKLTEQMGAGGSNVINLFHCQRAKRAAFFVLEACSRLGSQLIYKDDYVTVTENEDGAYVILILNPCYCNPLYAMDYNFTRLQEKRVNVALLGLLKGNYRVKTFKYSMNFSFAINDKSSIHSLYDVEVYRYGDPDVISYMQSIASPEFATYEKEIDGVHTLEAGLSLNAMELHILKKV